MLKLFEQHAIKAALAMAGLLFLQSGSRNGPDNHSHVLQPEYSWHPDGWLSHDPFSNLDEAPFFYAPDIVDRIPSSTVPHGLFELPASMFYLPFQGIWQLVSPSRWKALRSGPRLK